MCVCTSIMIKLYMATSPHILNNTRACITITSLDPSLCRTHKLDNGCTHLTHKNYIHKFIIFSYLTVIVVHKMHLFVHDQVTFFHYQAMYVMITHTHPIAGNSLIKTLVVKAIANNYIIQ